MKSPSASQEDGGQLQKHERGLVSQKKVEEEEKEEGGGKIAGGGVCGYSTNKSFRTTQESVLPNRQVIERVRGFLLGGSN